MTVQVPSAAAGGAKHPVVVIGAGPVGLAAAAHLAARDVPFTLLEAGPSVATSLRDWAHVRLFSPWRYDVDAAARDLLAATGWRSPDPERLPTAGELIEQYLEPLAAHPALAPHLQYDRKVEAISRQGYDRVRSADRARAPFVVRVRTPGGGVVDLAARAIIDASGTWNTPNPLGANGLPAYGEADQAASIVGALPDVSGAARGRFLGQHALVLGAGHSAVTTVLALAELAVAEPQTRVTWGIRSTTATRAFGGGEADALPARGALGTRLRQLVERGAVQLVTEFFTHALVPSPEGGVDVHSRTPSGVEQTLHADIVVNATGFRPDHSLAAELRLALDPVLGSTPALAPLIDPNHHACGTVPPHGVDQLAHPEEGYFAVGVKSYGRAPTFLLATGYEQVRSVSAALAGDWTAARDVRLELPETGVCAVTFGTPDSLSLAGDQGCGAECAPGTPRVIAAESHRGLVTGLSGGLLMLEAEPEPVGQSGGGQPG